MTTASPLRRARAAAETGLRLLLRSERAGPPAQLYVVVNEVCDLRCRMCGFWQGLYEEPGRTLLDGAEMRALFERFARAGTKSLVLTGGEPFLRDDLLDLVAHGVERFPFVRLQTNGMHLDPDAVERLVRIGPDVLWVSLDGVGELHDRIRGHEGAFDRLQAGLVRLREARRAAGSTVPALQINTTVLPENVGELEPLIDLAEELEARHLSFHQVSDLGKEAVERTEVELGIRDAATLQFSRKRQEGGRAPGAPPASFFRRVEVARRAGRVRIEVDPLLESGEGARSGRGCTWPWGVLMVGPYGDVLACQSLDRWKMGNVRDREASAIWNDREFRHLRKQVLKGLTACEQCCVPFRSIADHLGHREHLERFAAGPSLRSLLLPHR